MAGRAPTARVIWEPPNPSLAKEVRPFGLYHAAPDEPIEDGIMPKEPGVPLCSYRGELREPAEGLLPPPVNCPLCLHQINRLGVTVAGAWAS